jgi:tRNA threonylcarbamoyladenosine biosynthesis protein TsaB
VCKAPDAPAVIGTGWFGAGSGFHAHGDALRQHYGSQLDRMDATLHPHARAMARLALPELLAGRGLPPEQATPLYVRDKVALKMHEQR